MPCWQPWARGAIVVGCSTAGQIANRHLVIDHCVLTAVKFEHVRLRVASALVAADVDQRTAARQLASALEQAPDVGSGRPQKLHPDEMPAALFVLAPGVALNGSALVDGLRDAYPAVPIAGGLAGDAAKFEKSWTYVDGQIHDRLAVVLAFYGPLTWGASSAGGWRPFGPVRRLSDCDGVVIRKLDDQPALDLYRRYLGEHAKGLPASALLFPFEQVDAQGRSTGVVRTILGIDDEAGSLSFAGDFRDSDYVRMMHASPTHLVDGAWHAGERAVDSNKVQGGVALLISCVGRRLVMGDAVEDEIESAVSGLGAPAVVTGFYSNGEIGPDEHYGTCRLHNQTMTVVWWDELTLPGTEPHDEPASR